MLFLVAGGVWDEPFFISRKIAKAKWRDQQWQLCLLQKVQTVPFVMGGSRQRRQGRVRL